ncbi:IclR family transcriptional regulator C-terminal domain-containing protein, partial [Hydrogenophaga sp.]|uniref:IclR family transcriptional regulator domain-containing protein n=1 Tax=Hydrogenophaga sp. TaxID=1904254 RepID=UPI003569FA91
MVHELVPFFAPIPMYALGILVCVVQTVVFCLLSTVYISMAIAQEEHELGVLALAVPLRNMQGRTVAALNAVASPDRFEALRFQQELMPLLLDAARELRPLL